MEQQNDNLRERLLSRLPQPESLPRYQEETASLMAKHEKALFWERVTARTVSLLGIVLYILVNSSWGPRLNTDGRILLDAVAAILVLTGGMLGLGYLIYRSKVDILKEVKQVQLQILELHAKLETSQR